MYEIDRAKFGAFIAELRKEKGITQKELAERLHISDKAVSKWETGHSIPDVGVLVPLAEELGVSVTELLECHRIETPEYLDTQKTEELVKKVIEISEEQNPQSKKKNMGIYMTVLAVSVLEILFLFALQDIGMLSAMDFSFSTFLVVPLAMIFGLYFWIFAKEKLPAYYDENKVNVYVDGMFHINMPGVYFHNGNWPHILKAVRMWSVFGMIGFPICYLALRKVMYQLCKNFMGIDEAIWSAIEPTFIILITLGFVLGGLFVPIYG